MYITSQCKTPTFPTREKETERRQDLVVTDTFSPVMYKKVGFFLLALVLWADPIESHEKQYERELPEVNPASKW